MYMFQSLILNLFESVQRKESPSVRAELVSELK
jgi:hypothetical protein